MSATFNSANDILVFIHLAMFWYDSFLLSAIVLVKCLKNMVHSCDIPPKQLKTKGVKFPCSIFKILSIYCLFFSCSFTTYSSFSDFFMWASTIGLNIPMPKNILLPKRRKFRADTSTLASSSLLPVLYLSFFPVSSVNIGSIFMSLEVVVSHCAFVSLNTLWCVAT